MPDNSVSNPSTPQVQTPAEVRTPAPVKPIPPERVPLPDVLRQIREDAAEDPAAYLNETLVPRGGE